MPENQLDEQVFLKWLNTHETPFAIKVEASFTKKITANFNQKYRVYYNKEMVLETQCTDVAIDKFNELSETVTK